jgi:hypothetical protein
VLACEKQAVLLSQGSHRAEDIPLGFFGKPFQHVGWPMLVSTLWPSRTAQTLAPLPRWQVMSRVP